MCYNEGMTTSPSSPILTIWHNNVGRPVECAGLADGYEGRSGISPFGVDTEDRLATTVAEWTRTVERYGAAIVTDNRTDRPWNHQVIGVGGGHNDADWAESRFQEGSQATWYENDNTWHDRDDRAALIVRRATKGDR